MRRSARPARVPRALWLISALHVLLLLTYSWLFPVFRPPDEPQHIDLVRAVRHDVGYPRFDERNLSEPLVHALGVARFDGPALRAPHLRAGDIAPRDRRPPFAALGSDDVQVPKHPNQLPSHPPLYYATAAAAQTVVSAVVPGARSWGFDREIGVLRLFSVLLLAPLPALAFAVTRRLRWSVNVALVAALLPLGIPQLFHVGSSVNNDNLLILLMGLCTWCVARVATDDLGWPNAVALGVLSGLAMLTKAFALVTIVWIVVAYAATWRRGVALRTAAARAAGALALAFAFGGWWWARNVLVFGQLQTGIKLLPPAPASFRPDPAWWLGRFGAFMPERFWGWFGWFDVRLPVAAVIAATTVVAVGLARAAVLAVRRRPVRVPIVLLLAPTIGILLLVLLGAYQGYVRTGFDEGLQGRYLFPGIVGLAPVVALGLTRLARGDGRHVPVAILGGAVAMHVAAITVVLGFYWGGAGALGRMASVVAWSPWPAGVPIAVAGATVAVAAVTGVELVRLSRRRLETVTAVSPAAVRRSA